MKTLIKKFVPPIFLDLLTQKQVTEDKQEDKQHFENFAEALQYCTDDAYEQDELIEVILKKTKRFVSQMDTGVINIWDTSAYNMLAMINPIIENKAEQIHVIDFGGACGAHYFHLRNLVSKNLKIKWIVIETPTMVKYAKELETEELSFVDNFQDALERMPRVDLLHTSGTLQCVDAPQAYLERIFKCQAKWVLFNRLGLNRLDRDVFTIHKSKLSWNGIGALPEGHTDKWIKYPFCFQSERKFLQALEEKYRIVAKFNDTSGMFAVNGEEIVGYGLLCEIKM